THGPPWRPSARTRGAPTEPRGRDRSAMPGFRPSGEGLVEAGLVVGNGIELRREVAGGSIVVERQEALEDLRHSLAEQRRGRVEPSHEDEPRRRSEQGPELEVRAVGAEREHELPRVADPEFRRAFASGGAREGGDA